MWDAGPNYFAIFGAAEASAGVFCAILGDALREQFKQFGWSWNEINKNDKFFWKEDLQGKVEGMRLGQFRKRRLGENASFKKHHTESSDQQFFVPTWNITNKCLICSKEE